MNNSKNEAQRMSVKSNKNPTKFANRGSMSKESNNDEKSSKQVMYSLKSLKLGKNVKSPSKMTQNDEYGFKNKLKKNPVVKDYGDSYDERSSSESPPKDHAQGDPTLSDYQ